MHFQHSIENNCSIRIQNKFEKKLLGEDGRIEEAYISCAYGDGESKKASEKGKISSRQDCFHALEKWTKL